MSKTNDRVKLTKTVLQSLASKSQEYAVWDTDVINFHVRIFPSGTKSYCVYYRVNGKRRRRSIGSFPTVRVGDAREYARKIITDAKGGRDPFGEQDRALQDQSVLNLWDWYWANHALTKKAVSSQKEDRRIWNKHLKPKFGKMLVSEVTFDDVQKLHSAMHSTPTEANRTIALLSKMMWC